MNNASQIPSISPPFSPFFLIAQLFAFSLFLPPSSLVRLTPLYPLSPLFGERIILLESLAPRNLVVIKGAIYFTLIEQIGRWVVGDDLSLPAKDYNAQVCTISTNCVLPFSLLWISLMRHFYGLTFWIIKF